MPRLGDLDLEVEITKLRLEPGDIAVLSTDAALTTEQAKQLCERFRYGVGDENRRVLVLAHGLKVSVLTRAEIEAMAE